MASPTSKGPRSNPSQRPASGHRPKAAPAPAPSSPPAPLAALVAGLAALIEAHQASATSGAALVLWQVLSSLHAMASRALAAPSAFALEALDGGPLAAGLVLREEGGPAARAAPQLSEVHRHLIAGVPEMIKELDEARWHLQSLTLAIGKMETARDPEETRQWLQCADEAAELAVDAVRLAEGSACVLSHHLVGCDIDCSPATHAARLARVWTASSESRASFDRIDLERAAAAFTGT